MKMERDALLREVDEELRRDQAHKMWEQYGTYIVGGVIALLVCVGGYKWWQGRQVVASERAGARFEEALDLVTAGKADEAQTLLQTIGTSSGDGYPMLAQLALAGQAVKSGKTEAAIAAYDNAASRARDQLVRDYARLQSVALKIDSSDFTEVKNRLNDMIGDKSPWRYLARELIGIAAIRGGQLDEARNLLAPLSVDPRASAAVRERSGALMNLVVSAELERAAPGKVEFEKTDPPAAAPDAVAPKAEPPRGKAVSPRGGTVKGK